MIIPLNLPTRFRPSDFRLRISRAFSLVEILIVVALLSVIVLGLMAMFGQTQRAFRAGMAQIDVLESGRATADLLARELGQTRPSGLSNTVNFYAWLPLITPLYQELPGSKDRRTNVAHELFFLTCENQVWTGVGYRISTPDAGVGTLYRYSASVPNPLRTPELVPNLFADFLNTPLDNTYKFSRVADGVVHLRVRAFDLEGEWITDDLRADRANTDIRESTAVVPGEVGLYKFFSNAVPAAVELELGFLETRTLERVRALPTAAARRNYLSNHVAQVHVFRQHIPISTVDVRAYQ